jgi:hypothetical protein
LVEKIPSSIDSTLESEDSSNYDAKIPQKDVNGAGFEYTHMLGGYH